jgi:hypothetical protein
MKIFKYVDNMRNDFPIQRWPDEHFSAGKSSARLRKIAHKIWKQIWMGQKFVSRGFRVWMLTLSALAIQIDKGHHEAIRSTRRAYLWLGWYNLPIIICRQVTDWEFSRSASSCTLLACVMLCRVLNRLNGNAAILRDIDCLQCILYVF